MEGIGIEFIFVFIRLFRENVVLVFVDVFFIVVILECLLFLKILFIGLIEYFIWNYFGLMEKEG